MVPEWKSQDFRCRAFNHMTRKQGLRIKHVPNRSWHVVSHTPPPFPRLRRISPFPVPENPPFLWEVLWIFPPHRKIGGERWRKMVALNSVHVWFSLEKQGFEPSMTTARLCRINLQDSCRFPLPPRGVQSQERERDPNWLIFTALTIIVEGTWFFPMFKCFQYESHGAYEFGLLEKTEKTFKWSNFLADTLKNVLRIVCVIACARLWFF